MKILITDSLSFSKKNKEWIFSINEINRYKIELDEFGEIGFKKPKKKETEAIALVEKNNYRLIFDLDKTYKSVFFYELKDDKNPFAYPFSPDMKEVSKLFDNYMKRGYISFLQGSELKSYGLKRIEQLIVLSSFSRVNLKKEVVSSKKLFEREFKTSESLELIPFLYACSKEYNYSISSILEYIHKLYFRGGCSNPYSKDGFAVYEDEDFFFTVYNKLINLRFNAKIIELKFEKTSTRIITINSKDNIILNYFNAEIREYASGMFYQSKHFECNIIKNINHILPLKDSFLTIQLLERQGLLIENDKSELILNRDLKEKLNGVRLSVFANRRYWDNIYSNLDYSFELEEIKFKKNKFVCPSCSDERFRLTPISLRCSNSKCRFKFLRTNLSNNTIKRNRIAKISLDVMLNSLSNNSQLIRSDSGNYFLVFLSNDKDTYKLWISKS